MLTYWHRLNTRRTLGSLKNEAALAIRDDGTGVLMKFRTYTAKSLTWSTISTVDTRRPHLVKWRVRWPSAHLSSVLPAEDGLDVVAMPMWRQPAWARWLRFLFTVLLWYLIGQGVAALGADGETAGAIATLLYPLVLLLTPRFGPVEVRSLEQLPLDSTNVVEYATQRLAGAHPEALEAKPHRERVLARIADVRAEYGALKLDLLARIDHPALFDGSEPLTARFLSVLVEADDVAEDLPLPQLEALASRLEVSFEVAKAHADAVGIHHLPDDRRDDARRAAKVARLARAATSDGERRAAVAQLGRILDGMALHYMPSAVETLAIEPD
ncbi:hypothetical protein [Tessaracoccus oleiagri]|uniref:Uncharacterized protein n=1 Tax=Tessaracoccus oleiagri TaxID=686624 RepID=A0A1G9KR87_9ACTN|nr:hypothetical protein [Tessaracoccus oleiagri]SDL52360.1 hypothetical protein SAMN04488242_1795 [Tessaracoccus oleiagri]